MSNLFSMPLLLGLVAFLTGWLTAKFSSYVGSRANDLEVPEHHREIRALQANLRIVQKEAEEKAEQLTDTTQQLETLQNSLEEMEATSQFQKEALDQAREAVKQETAKVVDLRRELTHRAEETIRAQVSARDSENELDLLKASADIEVNDEQPEDTSEDLSAHLQDFDDELRAESEDGEAAGGRSRVIEGVIDC